MPDPLRFTGKPLVIGPAEPVEYRTQSEDRAKSRNATMVEALLRPDVNGMFLFYLHRNDISIGNTFVLPPGLTPEQSQRFQAEFLTLFERYAKLAQQG